MRLIQSGIALRTAGENDKLDKLTKFEIHPFGGAFVPKNYFDENIYLSIDSKIGLRVKIGSKSKVISTSIPDYSTIGEKATITNTKGGNGIQIGSNVILNHVSAESIKTGNNNIIEFTKAWFIISGNDCIIKSTVTTSNLIVENSVVIENMNVGMLRMDENAQIQNFHCTNKGDSNACNIYMEKNSKISNVSAALKEISSSSFNLVTRKNSTIANLTLNNIDQYAYGDYPGALIIPNNKILDFKGASLCEYGRFSINGNTRLGSIKKAERMCKAK